MKIGGYDVQVDRSEDGTWGASFPDGPPVISVADTREEVLRLQQGGLEALLEVEAEERAKAGQAARR